MVLHIPPVQSLYFCICLVSPTAKSETLNILLNCNEQNFIHYDMSYSVYHVLINNCAIFPDCLTMNKYQTFHVLSPGKYGK